MFAGDTILHYKILEKLGEGGMGVVYKSEDSRLKRLVAIKFLPHFITSDIDERKRFEIEAQAAAALNHQNITHIYAIEETSDEIFIVMEYIEGIELKEKIKSGPIEIYETIKIAIQISEGLNAAHKKGIIHRDIKSSNIMITKEGIIKIMDFGLAKIGGTNVTKIGATMGTIAYMSPEQARGTDVDSRTDIWSLGVLLYEVLTGELPFKGSYDQAIIYSIFNEAPVSASVLRPETPSELNNIILKCLRKDPELRYQNLNELLTDLKNLTSSNSVINEEPQLKRIAILPFMNVSGIPQSDYLGFALADQVIGALAYSKNVLVRPSASIRKYINSTANPKDVGSDLNVEYLLSGNFLDIEGQIRLNFEFVEIKTENLLWRESIKVKFKDAFELQDIVSQKVADGLKLQFSNKEKERINKDVPVNPAAYEYYLKAIAYNKTEEQNGYAIQMLEKSIELDGDYAPSWLELGIRYHFKSCYLLGSEKDFQTAINFIKKAIEINNEFATALSTLGILYTEIGAIDKSVDLLRKSLEIKPNEAYTHFALSYAYRYGGALEEAKSEAENAIALHPGNPSFRSIGSTHYYIGEFDKAKVYLDYDSQSNFRHYWFGLIELQLGNEIAAKDNFNKIDRINENGLFARFSNFFISYINNDQIKIKEALTALENAGFLDAEDFYWVAVCFALNNDAEGCARWLERAIESGFIIYSYMISERFLNNVKNDHRIKELFNMAKEKHLVFRKRFFS